MTALTNVTLALVDAYCRASWEATTAGESMETARQARDYLRTALQYAPIGWTASGGRDFIDQAED